MDICQLFDQDQHFFIGQRQQLNNRGQEIFIFPGEVTFCKSGAQGFVAVYTPAGILHALGRAAKDEADVLGFALHGIVVHGQDFFIVILPGDGIGDLIDVHKLVDKNQHTRIACLL